MRDYTDIEIFDKLKELFDISTFKNNTIIAIQSDLDNLDDGFPDKFFLYNKDKKFICSATGTTRSGQIGLKQFINKKGLWVWKTNMFYENCFKFGLHQGKMKALRLNRNIYGYRDFDKDNLHEEIGIEYYENPACNFHGVSYEQLETNEKIAKKVSTWSYGCQVLNKMLEYRKFIKFVYENGGTTDYALLKQF